MQDITLNGVSINELKRQRDLIQPQAAAFVADAIKDGARLVKRITVSETSAEAEELAQQALDKFETAKLVAGVAGIEYNITGDLSYKLMRAADDDDTDYSVYDGTVGKLHDLLEEMEQQVEGWNSSSRYC